jgi:hypothetical protein
MGVLRFFASVIRVLHANPQDATDVGLDEIAANAKRFSYIGNRKTLNSLVRQEADELLQRLCTIPEKRLEALKDTEPALVEMVRAIKSKTSRQGFDVANAWFGSQWEKDSGVFPDFLLALDDTATFGNGALLELKASKGDSIASFNSTIPTRFKSLRDVRHISGKNLVPNAARLYDFPLSANAEYLSAERPCFYLVRTQAKNDDKVKISLVEGSFFETLPKEELLARVWEQILEAGGVTAADRSHIVELLASLEQKEIARTREIERASIKPRLRLMAEVHPDALLHSYAEIKPRTANLVIKRERGFDETWLQREFAKEGLQTEVVVDDSAKFLLLAEGESKIKVRYFVILHKRNGEHIVLQYNLR